MELPHIRVVAAVIARDGKYLITQRRPNAVLPLLWEFPGGKVEEGESDAEALRREIRHRLGVEIATGERIGFQSHAYERYVVDLYTYDCTIRSGTPEPRAVQRFEWVKSDEFESYEFTPPDEASVAKLLDLGRE
jgi:8-oxo-dGTP diphosphatase